MAATGGDSGPVGVCADLGGSGSVRGGTVTELPDIVIAPAPQGAIGLDAA